jgi:hypothetical protein
LANTSLQISITLSYCADVSSMLFFIKNTKKHVQIV